jgi:hypothetical protein
MGMLDGFIGGALGAKAAFGAGKMALKGFGGAMGGAFGKKAKRSKKSKGFKF